MPKLNGVHHLALSTGNMKEQLTFFTDVMGMELVALYFMHGVEGAWHGFLQLGDDLLAFVFQEGNKNLEIVFGETHPGTGAGTSIGGTMQHLAFNVATEEDMMAMRDRIRAAGHPVFGPADHGLCKSIYFAGPEGLALEVATSEKLINGDQWIDPEVVALAGISSEELAKMRNPSPTKLGSESVAQPKFDAKKYHMPFPEQVYQAMMAAPDEAIIEQMTYTDPPVPAN